MAGVKLLNPLDMLHSAPHFFGFHEDFDHFVTGDRFTDTSGDTGASAAIDADGVGGIVDLVTGATDNNEAYLLSTQELFKFQAGKPLVVQCRLKFSEANTDDANVAFGLMDAVGADSILDNGAGPKASYSGAVWFKVDGETRWRVESSVGASQTTDETEYTAGGGNWVTLRIEVIPSADDASAEVRFLIDTSGGQGLVPATEYNARPRGTPFIAHTVTLTSTTEMMVFVGVKAGGANSETVSVDYIDAWQAR